VNEGQEEQEEAQDPAAPAEPVEAQDPAAPAETVEAKETGAPAEPAKPKGKRKGKGRRKPPALPRSRADLPINELRDASRATMDLFGPERAVRESFSILAPRERNDISALVAADEDARPRARNIANGSLGAGRIDKAMAATIISMAPQQALWTVALDREQAAQRLGKVRAAKQRDRQRSERAKERRRGGDRVSKEQLKAAQDGSVGATIRFVTEEDRRREREEPKGDKPKGGESSVLDELGY
jgi:hypothetical protein